LEQGSIRDASYEPLRIGIEFAIDSTASPKNSIRCGASCAGEKTFENASAQAELADRSDGFFANISGGDQQIDDQLGRHLFACSQRYA